MSKRLKRSNESSPVSTWLYDAIYSETTEFPFAIHSKKLQEAEALFQASLTAAAAPSVNNATTKTLIAIKGPTGCGKGFLYAHLKKVFGHLARFNELDEDQPHVIEERPSLFLEPMMNGLPFPCSKSVFPALQLVPVNNNNTRRGTESNYFDSKVSVLRLTDAHFQCRDVRRVVDELAVFEGIVLAEFTESRFEGSTTEYALKLLKESFQGRFFALNLNPCAPQLMRKCLLNSAAAKHLPSDLGSLLEQHFRGDARAFLHDLFTASLLPACPYSFPCRDNSAEFFHCIGKLVYPAKREAKDFDEESFWDVDLEALLLFVQYYLPRFVSGLEMAVEALDAISVNDTISWKVKNHVSLQSHPCNALGYGVVLAVYCAVNSAAAAATASTQKRSFFSFSKPPSIINASKPPIRHPEERFLLEQLLKQQQQQQQQQQR